MLTIQNRQHVTSDMLPVPGMLEGMLQVLVLEIRYLFPERINHIIRAMYIVQAIQIIIAMRSIADGAYV